MSELNTAEVQESFDEPVEQEVLQDEQSQEAATEAEEITEGSAPTEPETAENTEKPKATIDGVEVEGPEGFQKAINKQHRKFREEQRRAQELEKRLQELEAKAQPQQETVDVPPPPDPWDEDYADKIRARDAALLRKAQSDAAKQAAEVAKAEQEKERQRLEYERAQALQNQFAENSKKLGIKEGELVEAQNKVIEYGVTPEIANTLLEDSDGPLLVQYLAANPLDLYDIVEANPVKAGLLLGQVKAKAAALKPKPSAAPNPATRVEGRGPPQTERGPKGATFE